MRPWLPPGEPRCTSDACPRQGTCGRRHAPLPSSGAIVADYWFQYHAFPDGCPNYVAASECVQPAAPSAPVKKGWW